MDLLHDAADRHFSAITRRLLIGFAASLALHLSLLAVLPKACTNCISTQTPDYRRLDARLVAGTAGAVAEEADVTANARSADFRSNVPLEAEGLSVDGLATSARSEPPPASKAPEARPSENAMPVFDRHEYLPTADLQIRPHPTRPIEPTIPDNADPQEVKVVLRIWISPEGKVDRVVTVSGPADERFSRSAATAFAMSRFSPGVKNGVPVGTEMTVEVVFDRETIAESRSSAQQ